jgi:predicted amidophosphoribosyltransferase
MPVWCPSCNAMLPDGTRECPRCGAKIEGDQSEDKEDFSRADLAWYSAYTIGIVIIPIVIALAIGLICILVFVAGRS